MGPGVAGSRDTGRGRPDFEEGGVEPERRGPGKGRREDGCAEGRVTRPAWSDGREAGHGQARGGDPEPARAQMAGERDAAMLGGGRDGEGG